MSYELQDNSGSLFRNNKKQDGDKQPDYRGSAKVNGVEKEIAAWVKQGAKGTFLSIKFSAPYQKPSEQKSPAFKKEDSGDLPF